jgi:hypothetical protein
VKTYIRAFCLATIAGFLTIPVFAQDPLKVAPQAYKLQLENEWVKVVRVHYAPHEKVVVHDHTLTSAAYVYLNDSGPVVFKHIEAGFGAITRQPTKAGSFRIFRSFPETHEVENLSDLPSDFLRVEFKTEPKDENVLRGKFFREEFPAGENFKKVQFENGQIRITRLVCGVGKKIDVSANANEPTLLIALSEVNLKVSRGKGKNGKLKLGLGQTEWVALNQQEQLENNSKTPVELLRFDFKTKPLSQEELDKKKKHEHPKN